MSSLDNTLQPLKSYLLGIMRILVGYMFMLHGATKLFDIPATDHFTGFATSLLGIGGMLEFFGGLFIILGLFTRPVAFVLSGQMAVVYLMFHSKGLSDMFLLPLKNGGDASILFSFVFLMFFIVGSGAFALDNLMKKR